MKTISRTELYQRLGAPRYVLNMTSPKTYNPVANQFEIRFENGVAFQSYRELIAVRIAGTLYLTSYHDYSRTTAKYATQWTGLTTDERRRWLNKEQAIFIED